MKKLKLLLIFSIISHMLIGIHSLQPVSDSVLLVNHTNLSNNLKIDEVYRFTQNSTSVEIIDINSASQDIETGFILFLVVFIPWVLYRKYKKNRKPN
ncbi:MAG: hypothetical protein ACW981_21210 [Candidatus Hodarchaeales archaeon]